MTGFVRLRRRGQGIALDLVRSTRTAAGPRQQFVASLGRLHPARSSARELLDRARDRLPARRCRRPRGQRAPGRCVPPCGAWGRLWRTCTPSTRGRVWQACRAVPWALSIRARRAP